MIDIMSEEETKKIRREIIKAHHRDMGTKGGSTTLLRHGKEHFSRISKLKKKSFQEDN